MAVKHLLHVDQTEPNKAFCGARAKEFASSVEHATCKPCVAVYRMTPASAFPECPSDSVPTVYVEHVAPLPEDYASAADDVAPEPKKEPRRSWPAADPGEVRVKWDWQP